jgi:hypothetical protein
MPENNARLKIGGINTIPQYRNIYLSLKDVLQICIQYVPVFVCEKVRCGSTEHPPNQVPEHHSCGGTLTAYEACIYQEFGVLFSPAVHLTLVS